MSLDSGGPPAIGLEMNVFLPIKNLSKFPRRKKILKAASTYIACKMPNVLLLGHVSNIKLGDSIRTFQHFLLITQHLGHSEIVCKLPFS